MHYDQAWLRAQIDELEAVARMLDDDERLSSRADTYRRAAAALRLKLQEQESER